MNDTGLKAPILFIDIETVPQYATYDEATPFYQNLWNDKAQYFKNWEEHGPSNTYLQKAGIYAEFGKIVCISAGYINYNLGQREFRIKSFASENEKDILLRFAAMLNHSFNTSKHTLCGHNIKEFDIPFLCRRMLVHDIALPNILDISGAKPWETTYIDTMQLWKFGDYKNYTSLKLLAHVFQLPPPKDEMEGKDVARVFWQENDLQKIQRYCSADVLTTARIYCKMNQMECISDEEVIYIT